MDYPATQGKALAEKATRKKLVALREVYNGLEHVEKTTPVYNLKKSAKDIRVKIESETKKMAQAVGLAGVIERGTNMGAILTGLLWLSSGLGIYAAADKLTTSGKEVISAADQVQALIAQGVDPNLAAQTVAAKKDKEGMAGWQWALIGAGATATVAGIAVIRHRGK